MNIRTGIRQRIFVLGHKGSHLFDHVVSPILFFGVKFTNIDIEPIIEGLLFDLFLRYEIASHLLHVIEITSIRLFDVALVVLLAVVVGSFQVYFFRYFASLGKLCLRLIHAIGAKVVLITMNRI